MDFLERDPFAPIVYTYPGATTLHREATPFQEIQVLEHPHFGRMLVLDGVVQLTERDEFFYHEMLVHVPLHAHGRAQRVLIIGGGDGGSLREVLKYPGVERVVLVEYDERVVEVSKALLPTLSVGFGDPRTQIVCEDGNEYLNSATEPFDIVIIDSTDPVGSAEELYSASFFRRASRSLRPEGILVIQSQSLHFHREFVMEVQRRLREVFPVVDLHTQALGTYAGNWWTFSVGSKLLDPRVVRQETAVKSRYYAPDIHPWLFLPHSLYARLMDGSLTW